METSGSRPAVLGRKIALLVLVTGAAVSALLNEQARPSCVWGLWVVRGPMLSRAPLRNGAGDLGDPEQVLGEGLSVCPRRDIDARQSVGVDVELGGLVQKVPGTIAFRLAAMRSPSQC